MLKPVFGNLGHLQVGDKVVVHTYHRKVDGEVIKKGTRLLTVKYNNTSDVFRIESGQYNGESNHLRVFAPEQESYNDRLDAVLNGLREAGFDLRVSCNLSLETLEAILAKIEELTV